MGLLPLARPVLGAPKGEDSPVGPRKWGHRVGEGLEGVRENGLGGVRESFAWASGLEVCSSKPAIFNFFHLLAHIN